jgi:hypothetical protein
MAFSVGYVQQILELSLPNAELKYNSILGIYLLLPAPVDAESIIN